MDTNYITSVVDLLIIASILVVNSCFSVSHELAINRKEEVFASGALSIRSDISRIQTYLVLSICFNFLMLFTTIVIFWPLDILFLFLLSYKVQLIF